LHIDPGMTTPLRPELIPPAHRHFTYLLGAATGFGIAAVIAAISLTTAPRTPSEPLAPPALEAPTPRSQAQLVQSEPAVDSTELMLVFRAGGESYAKLADLGVAGEPALDRLPRHAPAQLIDDDTGTTAVAAVALADVSEPYRELAGQRLRVDRGCIADVVGFAVVSRLIGDPLYAGEADEADEAWTVDTVMTAGDKVLAARLSGCEGSYARRAALAPIVTLEPRSSAALAEAARSALLATDAARETQQRWAEAEGEGAWIDHVELDTRVLRHPLTRVTWVSVHGNYTEGCGGPEVNVWGLFRVTSKGALETVEARVLDNIHAIDELVDLEGDGQPEVLGRDWLGTERILMRSSGTELDRLRQRFYGCPC
jgi:hypothetical protein